MPQFPRRVRRPHRCKPTIRRCEWLERRELFSVNVLNYRYDQSGTGVNSQETALTLQNVNANDFGKLASTPVDGQIYGEPLYVSGVNVGGAIHNVVYVATEHDSVYAIDSNSGAVLWHDSLLGPGVTSVPWQDTGSSTEGPSPAIQPELGITATPVIDPNTNSIYVLANTKEVRADGTHYLYKLHALNLQTGAENLGGPLTIADTISDLATYTYVSGPSVNGTGTGSVNGKLTFNALRELDRVALTEVDGNIFMAFGSHPDVEPAHGWVLAVNARTMSLWGAMCLTPNGDLGDVWQDGNAVTVDAQGNMYVVSGNGTFDSTLNSAGFPVNGDYGDSIVKFTFDPSSSPTHQNVNGYGLKVVDYFTPSNEQFLDDQDLDLGSGGIVLLPASAGTAATPDMLIQGGKQGTLYLMNSDNMPGFNPSGDQIAQEANGPFGMMFSTPAYFNGKMYYALVGGHAEAFSLTNGQLGTTPSSISGDIFGYPGATPSISANGTTNGIVWMIANGSNELRAYNAANLADELYTSDQAPGGADAMGTAVKFTVPTVADGHVFVGGANSLVIYGLLSSPRNVTASGTPNQNFIDAVYQSILGRAADPAALAYWTPLLDQGAPRSSLTLALTHSDEYDARIIEGVYQKYLGRAADPASLVNWTALMQGGLSDEQLEADFIGSAEYYLHSGGTDKSWVDAMYEDLLGRAADAAGEAYWVNALASGARRAMVAYGFAASAEREADVIQNDYTTYLGRTASNAEVAGWVMAFEAGDSNENVIAGFAASDEYFKQYSTGA
ncbi:MAG TPA: DUF4214 domain-containing protein [Pirellulales bacterium]|nr:DUF4214 domain-containing protein [Pirellulales bacterium]